MIAVAAGFVVGSMIKEQELTTKGTKEKRTKGHGKQAKAETAYVPQRLKPVALPDLQMQA
jgi:hypothetical protein